MPCVSCQHMLKLPYPKKLMNAFYTSWIAPIITGLLCVLTGVLELKESKAFLFIGIGIALCAGGFFVYHKSRIAIIGLMVLSSLNIAAACSDENYKVAGINALLLMSYVASMDYIFSPALRKEKQTEQ